jgi:DNA-binding CsgD family transcriptional regulator
MSQIALIAEITANWIDSISDTELPKKLALGLKSLVEINDVSIILFRHSDLPTLEYFDDPMEGGSKNIDLFVKGAFLIDPFYLVATQKEQRGFVHFKDIIPSGFKQTEYYRSWYSASGLKDECGYLISLPNNNFINISLGRTGELKNFSKKELSLLDDLTPLVEKVCQQHWTLSESDDNSSNIRARMQHALDHFGSSLLTQREKQVVHLILHGHTTKTVSEELNIVVETVKLHRKHAYAKLDINSQSELFYLFIDSLMSVEEYVEGDPLSNYM